MGAEQTSEPPAEAEAADTASDEDQGQLREQPLGHGRRFDLNRREPLDL